MTTEQDFLVFAGGVGANVVSQATYAGLAALSPGFATGIAASDQLNKVWRQSSLIASMVAQWVADNASLAMVDTGDITTLEKNYQSTVLTAEFAADTGSANSYAISFPSGIVTPVADGTLVRIRPAHNNTGASTLAVNGASPVAIKTSQYAACVGGEIVANGTLVLEYNASKSAFVIVENPGAASGVKGVPAVVGYVSGTSVTQQAGLANSISGVVNGSTGVYVVSWTTAFGVTTYNVQVCPESTGDPCYAYVAAKASGSVTIHVVDTSSDALMAANFSITASVT
jgi:hypothetical protein